MYDVAKCSIVISLHPVAIISIISFQIRREMSRDVKCLLAFVATLALFSSAYCIVGGRHAAVPPFDDPVVFVNHIGRFSRVEGYHDPVTDLYTFRGIKYADPPVRENRFLRPRSKHLSGDVNARRNAPPCPQPDYYGKYITRPSRFQLIQTQKTR